MDPSIIIAVVGGIGAIATAWLAARKDVITSKVTAQNDTVKVVGEISVKREELLQSGIELHMKRLDEEVDELRKVIKEMNKRIGSLEDERRKMLSWMALNQLAWPPPEDAGV